MYLDTFEHIEGMNLRAKFSIEPVLAIIEAQATASKPMTQKAIASAVPVYLRNARGHKIKDSSDRPRRQRPLHGTEFRAIIHVLRRNGYPIGSSGKGYFFCRTPEEMDSSIHHLSQRINSIEESRDDLINIRRRMEKGIVKTYFSGPKAQVHLFESTIPEILENKDVGL